MPFAPPHVCALCRGIHRRGERCPRSVAREQAADRERGTAAARGYDARWRAARAAFLAAHPLCAACGAAGRVAAAEVVDHIVPHRGDDALFWDVTNWQPLCKPCHDRKTARGE